MNNDEEEETLILFCIKCGDLKNLESSCIKLEVGKGPNQLITP